MNKKDFNNFNNYVFEISHQFYIWRFLQNSKNTSGYNQRGHFWKTLLSSLHNSFLLNIALIFSHTDKKCLNIYTFLEKIKDEQIRNEVSEKLEEDNCKKIRTKLKRWRDNHLAHKNEKLINTPGELEKRWNLKYQDIENLLEFLIYTLNSSKEENDITDYFKYYSELEERCKEHTKFVLQYGLNTPEYNSIHQNFN